MKCLQCVVPAELWCSKLLRALQPAAHAPGGEEPAVKHGSWEVATMGEEQEQDALVLQPWAPPNMIGWPALNCHLLVKPF